MLSQITEDLSRFFARASDHGKSELDRINFLDGWRGIAIALVLMNHFTPPPIWGYWDLMGVDVFFVLSGMLMSNILFTRRTPLTTFYKRRISRVFPVFLLYVTLVYAASYLFQLSNEHENFFYTVTFLRAYIPTSPHMWDTGIPIGHIWSLNVEEHCYVLLSLVAFFKCMRGREHWVLLGIGILSILIQLMYRSIPEITPPGFNLRTEVAASHLMLSAGYFLVRDRFVPYVRSWMVIAACILAVFCYYPRFNDWASWTLAPLALAFAVNHLQQLPKWSLDILNWRPLRLLGLCSFSVYLWQQPFYFYGVKFGQAFPFAGPVLLIASLLAGVISFALFENPVRRFLNNRWT